MTCSQQPELGLSLNYTDGQRNMWSYYAPNGRRYRQILVERQCLCGSRLNWTNWEDVTISPERVMGLEWRLTGVKWRASSGCVQRIRRLGGWRYGLPILQISKKFVKGLGRYGTQNGKTPAQGWITHTHKMTNSSSTNNPNPTILGLMESSLERL